VGERLFPEPIATLDRKGLSQFFIRKSEAGRARVLVDWLQVPEFVKENIIEHESADRQHRPLMIWLGSKLCGCLTLHQCLPQTHARR
jgi:hypothetical protein